MARFQYRFVLGLLFSLSAQAADLQTPFERLKDSGEKYEVTGTVCEQVAKIELERSYSKPAYLVTTGIAYADNRRVLGELDVIVFDRASRNAVLVGEVKCWQNLNGAQKKARAQRARFQQALASGSSIDLFDVSRRETKYDRRQFSRNVRFISISQQGGESAGFDMSLNYSLDELMQLRQMLVSCQRAGECRRPE
jgi:hypothetical protein